VYYLRFFTCIILSITIIYRLKLVNAIVTALRQTSLKSSSLKSLVSILVLSCLSIFWGLVINITKLSCVIQNSVDGFYWLLIIICSFSWLIKLRIIYRINPRRQVFISNNIITTTREIESRKLEIIRSSLINNILLSRKSRSVVILSFFVVILAVIM